MDHQEREAMEVPGRKGRGTCFTNGDGYYFHRNNSRKQTEGKVYLKCAKCSVRAVLENSFIRLTNEDQDHSHPPDTESHEVTQLKQDLKIAAQESTAPLKEVFSQVCSRYDVSVASQVTFVTASGSMYTARQNRFPAVPHSLEELHNSMIKDSPFVEQYGKDSEGSLICQGIAGPPGHRSVVFSTRALLNVFLAATWVFLDGTFSVRPDCPPSRQLLVISALHLNCLFPVAFVLMESKDKIAYHHLFEFLKDTVPGLSPKYIVSDFEAALVDPIAEIFPDTRHQGCWFHYCQALHRKIRSLGLYDFVKGNATAAMFVRMCYVLPLLPAQRMLEGFNALEYMVGLNNLPQLSSFLSYVKETWLERVGVHKLTVYNSVHRTNNFVESYHRRFQDRVKVRRPGTWQFIQQVHAEFRDAMADILGVQQSLRLQRARKPRWVRQDVRIVSALQRLDAGQYSMADFLVAAQNGARTLQAHQLHVNAAVIDAEDPEYPAEMPPVVVEEDANEVLPANEHETQVVEDHEGEGSQDAPSQGASTSVTLILPPSHMDFTNPPAIAPATPRRSPTREPVEPHASPVRGRRRGRPRLARPAGLAQEPAQPPRGRGRPRGSRARGRPRGRGARGRGARGRREAGYITQSEDSEAEDDPAELPEEFMDADEVRTRREVQMRQQETANAAAAAAAQAPAPASSDNECKICCAAPRTHAATPCGHRFCCAQCAGRLLLEGLTCPVCRADVLMIIQIYD